MAEEEFDIRIINTHWIKNIDDPNDLCAHGHVYVRIGQSLLSDENSPDWTVSSTALYLLRSLETDYTPGE